MPVPGDTRPETLSPAWRTKPRRAAGAAEWKFQGRPVDRRGDRGTSLAALAGSSKRRIASIECDHALILPHCANPAGSNFREPHPPLGSTKAYCLTPTMRGRSCTPDAMHASTASRRTKASTSTRNSARYSHLARAQSEPAAACRRSTLERDQVSASATPGGGCSPNPTPLGK